MKQNRCYYVVVRQVEMERRDFEVFLDRDGAIECFKEAYLACLDGPGDAPEDDMTVVTYCWLYEVVADNEDEASEMACDGRAKLMREFNTEDGDLSQFQ